MATPIPASERIYALDVIRGFALLGIFIMNMPWFNTSFHAGLDGAEAWPAWWDQWTETATDVLFSGKFNSMFSMLFAVGFTIQLERLEARDPEHARAIYLRRLFWLFVFGAIHMCVFWQGDVLHMYALLGLLLPALRRAPARLLWGLFFLALFLPLAVAVYRYYTFVPVDRAHILAMSRLWVESNEAAYGHGSFFAAAREHTREAIYLYTDEYNLRITLRLYAQLFATMLIGLMLGRAKFFQNAASHLPLVRRVQWWSLGCGLATGTVFGIWQATATDFITPSPSRLVAAVSYVLCRVLIMIFYVATLVRCVHSANWRRRLQPIAKAGRMPLTNYLMQTLIATAIFYGWGLGLWGKVGNALDLLLAVSIFFLVQVPFSQWWLARHELGPLEWVWRRLTYGSGFTRAPAREPTA
ncbi:MAG TPA: DUF418 domain-containing protein [Steroidobacteraceae bacterium]|nr:DUF418 domain-containing protein [Steroidobacteraceae bacterium]